MKALIVSDNHRNLAVLEELIDIYQDEIDLWLHCGDSEFMASDSVWKHFKTVRGNMDIDSSLPLERIESFGDEKVVVVHGHQHRVGLTLDYLKEIATEKDANIVFYGHTHIAKVNKINDTYFINPGSIVQPRGSLRVGTYAMYEKNEDGRFISYYDWDHNKLPELSMKLT